MTTIKADIAYAIHRNPDYIKINTAIDSGVDSIYKQMSGKIIQLEDAAVKEALKKLGWISPEDAEKLAFSHAEDMWIAKNDAYLAGFRDGRESRGNYK